HRKANLRSSCFGELTGKSVPCGFSQFTSTPFCRVDLPDNSIRKGGSTMPRPPKPYLERDWYVSRAGGEYIKLCRRSQGLPKANAILRDHLKQRERQREQNGGSRPASPDCLRTVRPVPA